MKRDATILADTNDLTKEEQVQYRSASGREKRLTQVNRSQEKIENISLQISNNENKPVMSNYTKGIKENGIEEDNALQQSVERSDQPTSELIGSQTEATEMT